jgi:hypothetical protein
MAAYLAGELPDADIAASYCEITWEQPYRELAGTFYTRFIPELQRIARTRCSANQTRVRIIIGFDS